MKKMYGTCQICGTVFVKKVVNQLYCCEECYKDSIRQRRQVRTRRTRKCPTCDKEFMPQDRRQRFCCDECEQKYVEATKTYSRRKGFVSSQRRCHDCGKLTYNYRCDKCLKKWRARYGVNAMVDVLDAYKCHRR